MIGLKIHGKSRILYLAAFCPFCTNFSSLLSHGSKLFPKGQILDSSEVKEFADNNCKFDENARKLSKWVENTTGKGEIACLKQFLFFPQCFRKTCTVDM